LMQTKRRGNQAPEMFVWLKTRDGKAQRMVRHLNIVLRTTVSILFPEVGGDIKKTLWRVTVNSWERSPAWEKKKAGAAERSM